MIAVGPRFAPKISVPFELITGRTAMKRLLSIALLASLVGCTSHHDNPKEHGKDHNDPHASHGKDEGKIMLMVQTEPATVTTGKPTTLKMMIHAPDGKMLKDFAVVHEQKIHLIIIRDGLDQFAHIHPEIDTTGNITATYTFPTGGTYRLYADHQPIGGSPATAMAEVKVAGDAPAIPSLKPDVPGKVKGDGLDAKVSIVRPKTAGEITIQFEVMDPLGTAATDLQPYMGAMGHLVVVSQDGRLYVHSHPMDEKKANTNVVNFMAHFPQPGLYKGWGQFKRQGQVHIVPFVLQVEK
jgi:hypothetical protein